MCKNPSDNSFLHGITDKPLALEVCCRTSGHRGEMLEALSICAVQGRRLLSLPVGEFPAEADEVTRCGLNTLEIPFQTLLAAPSPEEIKDTLSFTVLKYLGIYHLNHP